MNDPLFSSLTLLSGSSISQGPKQYFGKVIDRGMTGSGAAGLAGALEVVSPGVAGLPVLRGQAGSHHGRKGWLAGHCEPKEPFRLQTSEHSTVSTDARRGWAAVPPPGPTSSLQCRGTETTPRPHSQSEAELGLSVMFSPHAVDSLFVTGGIFSRPTEFRLVAYFVTCDLGLKTVTEPITFPGVHDP